MKQWLRGLRLVVLFGWLALGGWASAAAAEVRVCEHARLGQPCVTLRHGVNDLAEWGISNRISSFSLDSGAWLMCTQPGFGGRCDVFTDSVADLDGTPFQNSISSLRPLRQGWGGPAGGTGSSNWGGWGGAGTWQQLAIAVYTGANYTGRSWVFSDDVSNLAELGLNNQVSSLRVYGGRWQICRQIAWRDCRGIVSSVPDLRRIGFNNVISSIREMSPGSNGPGWGTGPAPKKAAVLFEDLGFGGHQLAVTGPVSDLRQRGFDNRVGSIRIERGNWQLCSEPGFRGHCQTATESVSNLGAWGMYNAISSVRPLP